jgi:hypothetical protein
MVMRKRCTGSSFEQLHDELTAGWINRVHCLVSDRGERSSINNYKEKSRTKTIVHKTPVFPLRKSRTTLLA